MTEAGSWHEKENRRYKNGPVAPPGRYTIRLTVEDEHMEQSFQLLIDPRLAEHVSIAEVAEQVALHRKVKALLDSARRAQDELEQERDELTKKKEQSTEDQERLSEVKDLITQLKTKEGIYELPRLVLSLIHI